MGLNRLALVTSDSDIVFLKFQSLTISCTSSWVGRVGSETTSRSFLCLRRRRSRRQRPATWTGSTADAVRPWKPLPCGAGCVGL